MAIPSQPTSASEEPIESILERAPEAVQDENAKQALIYLRVSTMRQATKGGEVEGYSIPAQRRACIARAAELGAIVIDEYVDAGASARSADRPQLQAMLSRIKQGGIDFVIVHKLDRLARSLADDTTITLALKMAGVTLVSVSEVIDETPSGKLAHGLHATIAEYYSSNLAFEAKKGMMEKVRRGGTPGYAPIGYQNVLKRFDDRDGRTIEIDEERAPHIVWAFQAYATGRWSISSLADALEERGLISRPTRKLVGTPLNGSQVHRILTNPYYMGVVTYKGVQYDGRHPKLVDEITFQKIQDILAGRRIAGDRSWRHGHYLKGSLICDRCGSRISYGKSRGKGGVYDYFFCLGRHTGRTTCDLPYLPVENVEMLVEAEWGTIHYTDEFIASVREVTHEELKTQLADTAKLVAQQKRRVTQLERQKQKLFDAYMADAMPVEELKTRQAKISHELVDAKSLIESGSLHQETVLTRIDTVVSLLHHARHLYISAGGEVRKLLNEAMFSALYVNAHAEEASYIPDLAEAELSEVVDGVVATIHDIDGPNEAAPGRDRAQGALQSGKAHTAPHTARRGQAQRHRGTHIAKAGNLKTLGKLPFTEGSNVAHLAVSLTHGWNNEAWHTVGKLLRKEF